MTRPRLVPELVCSNLSASLSFYVGVLGFRVLYDRPENGFAFLEREGAELMLDEKSPGSWLTGEMAQPFGRGINLQIEVSDVATLRNTVRAAPIEVYRETEDAWYRAGDGYTGNRQFILQDPDGYLLRFFEDLGRREVAPEAGSARVLG
jgi:catechol 2,3-dioxygenase-like lactoylglutathione lyase family enzyme